MMYHLYWGLYRCSAAFLLLLTACSPLSATLSSDALAPTQTSADVHSIRLANGEWAPYNGADLANNGCDSWIVREAFALEGIDVAYSFFPWARSYFLSASGEWDGTLTWADTPEHRADHFLSARPITHQEFVFSYRADHPIDWKTLDDLAGKTIGVTSGYVYNDAFKDLRKTGKAIFIESPSDEDNFRMLLAGRIDVFPIERQVGRYLLNQIFTSEERSQITFSSVSFSRFDSYLLLSKKISLNQDRIALYDAGFEKLQTSGRYAEILQACEPE